MKAMLLATLIATGLVCSGFAGDLKTGDQRLGKGGYVGNGYSKLEKGGGYVGNGYLPQAGEKGSVRLLSSSWTKSARTVRNTKSVNGETTSCCTTTSCSKGAETGGGGVMVGNR